MVCQLSRHVERARERYEKGLFCCGSRYAGGDRSQTVAEFCLCGTERLEGGGQVLEFTVELGFQFLELRDGQLCYVDCNRSEVIS